MLQIQNSNQVFEPEAATISGSGPPPVIQDWGIQWLPANVDLGQLVGFQYGINTSPPQLQTTTDITFRDTHNPQGFNLVGSTGPLTAINFPNLIDVPNDSASFIIKDNVNIDTISMPVYLPFNFLDHNFSGNALTQATVDGILARFVASVTYVSGTLDLSGGTNSPPSVVGAAYVLILTGRGVTVITN